MRSVLSSEFTSGTVNFVSKVPILPVVFSRAQNFNPVGAGRRREAAVIENGTPRDLPRRFALESNLDVVAHDARQFSLRVADLPDKIKLRRVGAAALDQLEF